MKPPATFTCPLSIDLVAYVHPLVFGQSIIQSIPAESLKKCQFRKEKCALRGVAGAPASEANKCTTRQGDTDRYKQARREKQRWMQGEQCEKKMKREGTADREAKREVHKGNSVLLQTQTHYERILD